MNADMSQPVLGIWRRDKRVGKTHQGLAEPRFDLGEEFFKAPGIEHVF